jgi:hypothetical protein
LEKFIGRFIEPQAHPVCSWPPARRQFPAEIVAQGVEIITTASAAVPWLAGLLIMMAGLLAEASEALVGKAIRLVGGRLQAGDTFYTDDEIFLWIDKDADDNVISHGRLGGDGCSPWQTPHRRTRANMSARSLGNPVQLASPATA